jgi:hypothetical protein
MAITSAICNSFKTEILTAVHNLSASGGNTFNLALYTSSATINKSTTAYSATNEMDNTSGSSYSAKGKALTNVTPVLDSDTAVCDFDNVSWTSATFTANGCLIFNDSASGDPAVCTIAFGGDKTVTSGTFTIEFPAAAAATAIIQLA